MDFLGNPMAMARVVCPKPRCPPNFTISNVIYMRNDAATYDSKPAAELVDVILLKDSEAERSGNVPSSPPLFGSPPCRTLNPIAQDARFTISPLNSNSDLRSSSSHVAVKSIKAQAADSGAEPDGSPSSSTQLVSIQTQPRPENLLVKIQEFWGERFLRESEAESDSSSLVLLVYGSPPPSRPENPHLINIVLEDNAPPAAVVAVPRPTDALVEILGLEQDRSSSPRYFQGSPPPRPVNPLAQNPNFHQIRTQDNDDSPSFFDGSPPPRPVNPLAQNPNFHQRHDGNSNSGVDIQNPPNIPPNNNNTPAVRVEGFNLPNSS